MSSPNNDNDIQWKEKRPKSQKQNSNINRDENMRQLSPSISSAMQETTDKETTAKEQESSLEQAFFFGLTIDDALNSAENLTELFYNACKYNHLELVKRCVAEKHINVNDSFNNDYPLCIAR